MNEELKACPFCGGKAETHFDHYAEQFITSCGPCEEAAFNTAEEAIDAWNQRADTAHIEALEARVAELEGLVVNYTDLSDMPDKDSAIAEEIVNRKALEGGA